MHGEPRDQGRMTEGADVAIVDVWTFRTEPTMTGGDVDLTGWKIEATDGEIGKVDEATYEVGGSYLVVDTGPWIFGKKVMLPAGVVDGIHPDEERVSVALTKDEIEDAPEFDEAGGTADEGYRSSLGEYYGPRTRR